ASVHAGPAGADVHANVPQGSARAGVKAGPASAGGSANVGSGGASVTASAGPVSAGAGASASAGTAGASVAAPPASATVGASAPSTTASATVSTPVASGGAGGGGRRPARRWAPRLGPLGDRRRRGLRGRRTGARVGQGPARRAAAVRPLRRGLPGDPGRHGRRRGVPGAGGAPLGGPERPRH